ncbi:MAG: peroxiredoxin-like family protein [Sphingomonadaceae bacterium]
MTHPLVAAIELAFQDVRDRKVPLGPRLNHIKDKVRSLSPPYHEAVDIFVARLERSGAGQDAPQIGDHMPNFILPDDRGHLVSLERLLETAPVAIAFHRGHWCPYCRLNAVGLAEVEDDIKPVQIVAISAETQAYTSEFKAEARAHFPFLTDFGNGYTLSLNLAVWVDDAMSSLIAGAGWDIPKYQGSEGWILPIPSVFIVGQDGLIKARHVDPDYRRRLELDDLRSAAKAALSTPSASPSTS